MAANGFVTVEVAPAAHSGAVILREGGAALLALLMVLVLISCAIILDRPQRAPLAPDPCGG